MRCNRTNDSSLEHQNVILFGCEIMIHHFTEIKEMHYGTMQTKLIVKYS